MIQMSPTSLTNRKEKAMSESVYKVVELVGSSPNSWEEAAKNAVETAGKSLRDLRVAEIGKLDMKVENGKVTAFRARVSLSFKYQEGQIIQVRLQRKIICIILCSFGNSHCNTCYLQQGICPKQKQ